MYNKQRPQVYFYHDEIKINMHSPENQQHSLKNFVSCSLVPLEMYPGLMFLIVPVTAAEHDSTKSSSTIFEKTEICCIGLVATKFKKTDMIKFDYQR